MTDKKRDAAAEKWLEEECEIPLPLDPGARRISELSLLEAFAAGWDARERQGYTQ